MLIFHKSACGFFLFFCIVGFWWRQVPEPFFARSNTNPRHWFKVSRSVLVCSTLNIFCAGHQFSAVQKSCCFIMFSYVINLFCYLETSCEYNIRVERLQLHKTPSIPVESQRSVHGLSRLMDYKLTGAPCFCLHMRKINNHALHLVLDIRFGCV